MEKHCTEKCLNIIKGQLDDTQSKINTKAMKSNR